MQKVFHSKKSRELPQLFQINLTIHAADDLMEKTGMADVNKNAHIAKQIDGHAVAELHSSKIQILPHTRPISIRTCCLPLMPGQG